MPNVSRYIGNNFVTIFIQVSTSELYSLRVSELYIKHHHEFSAAWRVMSSCILLKRSNNEKATPTNQPTSHEPYNLLSYC